jgi:very-short-patch-repair endonuclease
MEPLRQSMSDSRTQLDAERLEALARRQHGVVSRRQLRELGLSDTMVARWLDAGRLHRLHRQVFAVGHTALSIDGRLHAALLYAGPEAVLSHTTAAWLWRLIDAEPKRVHLTALGRRSSLPGVRVHHSRQVAPFHCRGFRVTSVARTLLDLAWVLPPRQIRRALAEAEFRKLLRPAEVLAETGSGRRGSRALKDALQTYLPQLAQTLSLLEQRFLELCQRFEFPIPEVNRRAGLMRVDAIWPDRLLAVEVDGGDAHTSWAQINRDRDREIALRARGYRIVRYGWMQVTQRPEEVADDLRRLLSA